MELLTWTWFGPARFNFLDSVHQVLHSSRINAVHFSIVVKLHCVRLRTCCLQAQLLQTWILVMACLNKKRVYPCRELPLWRGLGKNVSGKPYPRLCNARRPRLEPGTFRSQTVRLYRLHQARPSMACLNQLKK